MKLFKLLIAMLDDKYHLAGTKSYQIDKDRTDLDSLLLSGWLGFAGNCAILVLRAQ
jgi:hypothetical protein